MPENSKRSNANQATVDELPRGARLRGRLDVVEGPGVGSTIDVVDAVVLGRTPDLANVVFDVDQVSSPHARIWCTATGSFQIEDLRSAAGTYVNDMRIQRRALIMGDRIRLGGHVVLVFSF
jgi:pSer/pThr/pTyr-binding forkhead associated (FHA) protein